MHARHVLIRTGGGQQSANPFAPPQSPRDQARAAVEDEKRKKLIEELKKRNEVHVAQNFTVKAPETPMGDPRMAPPGAGVPEGTSPETSAPPAANERRP